MYIRNVPKEIKDMLLKISESRKLPYRLVEDVYFHEFRFLSEMMEKGEKDDYDSYENILLKEFGSFVANDKHIKKLNEIANANEKKNNEVCER